LTQDATGSGARADACDVADRAVCADDRTASDNEAHPANVRHHKRLGDMRASAHSGARLPALVPFRTNDPNRAWEYGRRRLRSHGYAV
jgi:hypothetical protein